MNPHETYSAKPDRGGFMVVNAAGEDVVWIAPGDCGSLVAATMYASHLSGAFLWGLEIGGDGEPDPVVEAIPAHDAEGAPVWRIAERGSGAALYGSMPRDPVDAEPPRAVATFVERVRERFAAGRMHGQARPPDTALH